MNKSRDILAQELSLQAHLDDSGLTAKVKSRTIAALDRLIGSAVDIPAAYFEGYAARIRAHDSTQQSLIEADGELGVEQLLARSGAESGALRVFLADLDRKHANRKAVVQETLIALTELPVNESSSPDDAKAIEDDWLNIFSSHAERASSDHLRWLWGRILAGEIRKPSSFSLTTLRVVSELDQKIASLFQSVMVDRLRGNYLPTPPTSDHETRTKMSFLEEVGLLQDVSAGLGINLTQRSDGYFYFANGSLCLRIRAIGKFNAEKPELRDISVGISRITRTGQELVSILPGEPDDRGLRVTARELKEKVFYGITVKAVSLGKVRSTAEGQVDFEEIEVLWDSEPLSREGQSES